MNKKPREPGNYTVGYKRPPKATQFKPGQSGCPTGRRKATQQPVDVLRSILNERVPVEIGGKRQSLRKFELFFRGLINRAANGDARATKQVLDLMRDYGVLKPQEIEHRISVHLVRPPEREDKRPG